MPQKVGPPDGEADCHQKEVPAALHPDQGDGEGLLSPTGNPPPISTRQAGARRHGLGLPWHDRESGAGVDQKPAARGAVAYVKQPAGVHRRNDAPAT